MAKQPWMKFHPLDWRADPGLRSCSFAARGLWIDMITLMHDCEPYGYLLVGGKPPSTAKLAAVLSGNEKEVQKLLAELEEANVFNRDSQGVIYSRRMVRDKKKADQDEQHGKRGGNLSLKPLDSPKVKAGDNGGVNPRDNGGDKARIKNKESEEEEITPPIVLPSHAPARDPAVVVGSEEEGEGKPSVDQKLAKLDAIFPGCGANITNLARFSDWERWNYDWALDVVPTFHEIAEQYGPGWQPGALIFFDKPIARRYHARISGHIPTPRRSKHRTAEEIRAILAAANGGG